MNSVLSATLVLACVTSLVLATPLEEQPQCKPGDNCQLPDCRCWNDKSIPGNKPAGQTPQMILITFDYSFNEHTVKQYMKLFRSLKNPNNCDAKGTFFVQAYGSNGTTLKQLSDGKHELAINSNRGIIPTTQQEWLDNIKEVQNLLSKAGVDLAKVSGLRAPQLASGGNDQFKAMQHMKLQYDSSCITVDYSDGDNLLWPYTMDYVKDLPYCSTGKLTDQSFKGIWEIPVPVLNYQGLDCPTPAGCIPNINTTDDVFRFFYDAFDNHYYNNRAPFVLDIDPQWMTEETRAMGTKQFLELVGAYPDTWVVTLTQALEWLKDPQPAHLLKSFAPWSC